MPRKDSPSVNGVAAMNHNLTTLVKILIRWLSRWVSNAASSVITPIPRGNGATTTMNRTTCACGCCSESECAWNNHCWDYGEHGGLQLKSKLWRHAADRCESPSICSNQQPDKVSKYCSCVLVLLYYFKQTKKKTKRKNSSVRGCSGIGTRKQKKPNWFFLIYLNITQLSLHLSWKRVYKWVKLLQDVIIIIII